MILDKTEDGASGSCWDGCCWYGSCSPSWAYLRSGGSGRVPAMIPRPIAATDND